MDFGDERYVRIYTRDTTTWKLLGFEGQAVLVLVLRKMNRWGVLELEDVSPAEAAQLHAGIPEGVAEIGMERCLKRGCLEVQGDRLVAPKYIEANEAKASAAERKRRQRERDRLASRHSTGADVTFRDSVWSRNVTESHELSQPVTDCHPKPSQAKPSQAKSDPNGSSSESRQSRDVRRVFEHWKSKVWNSKGPEPRLDGKRKSRISARLREGLTVEQLCQAVDGALRSPWHTGDNPAGKTYLGIQTLLRDRETVEGHIERLIAPTQRPGVRALTPDEFEVDEDPMEASYG